MPLRPQQPRRFQARWPTLAEDMRFRAMLPEASTTKMTSAPALRARRLLRMSGFSTYTCTHHLCISLSPSAGKPLYKPKIRLWVQHSCIRTTVCIAAGLSQWQLEQSSVLIWVRMQLVQRGKASWMCVMYEHKAQTFLSLSPSVIALFLRTLW